MKWLSNLGIEIGLLIEVMKLKQKTMKNIQTLVKIIQLKKGVYIYKEPFRGMHKTHD